MRNIQESVCRAGYYPHLEMLEELVKEDGFE